jgi:hypothetical protein
MQLVQERASARCVKDGSKGADQNKFWLITRNACKMGGFTIDTLHLPAGLSSLRRIAGQRVISCSARKAQRNIIKVCFRLTASAEVLPALH